MIDLGNQIERVRLHRAIQTSRDALDPFRRVRNEFVRDYVGSWYSELGARYMTYCNKLNQTAQIYTFALAANNPRYKLATVNPQYQPFCYHFQENLNKLVVNINLETTLQLAVLDAFFFMAMVVVRMADADPVQLEDDTWVNVGQPWVDRISADNMILDLSAYDLTKMRFAGHRYRCAFWKLKQRDDFDQKIVKKLAPNSKYTYDTGTDYANMIANGQMVDDDELEPMIWLEDVWIAENKQWCTFAATPGNDDLKPLKVMDWEGSPRGPYKFLGLGFVPDNVIPSSPAQNLKGLHDLYNRMVRKLAHQATISKQVVAYPPGEEKEADTFRNAKNGDWVKSKDPKQIQTVTIGSVDGNINAFSVALDEVYNAQSGNVRSLAGLGQEAGTAKQEEMIQSRSSQVVTKMALNVLKFAGEIGEELKQLMWDDQALIQENWVQAGDTGQSVPSHWTPENRQGKPDNYTVSVEPYSMAYRSPAQKMAQINQVLNQLGPLWPMFAQSGAVLDVQRLLAMMADNMDLPELKQIIVFSHGGQQGGQGVLGGDQNTIRSPAVTTRNVVRRNVPTGGTAGNRAAMMAGMMTGQRAASPQQMASMGRPGA